MSRAIVVWMLTVTLAILVVVPLAGRRAQGASLGDLRGFGKYAEPDRDQIRKAKQERLAKDVEKLAAAVALVEKEKTAACEALDKAKADAAKKAGTDPDRLEQLYETICKRAIPKFEKIDAKYGRARVVARALGANADLTAESKAQVGLLLARIKVQCRGNLERIADLCETTGQSRKALSVYETVYQSIPEASRGTETALKDKINQLREKLGLKRID